MEISIDAILRNCNIQKNLWQTETTCRSSIAIVVKMLAGNKGAQK
jgi:hypothetical protein